METGTEAGTGRERGWRPVDDHRMGTGMEAGTETKEVAEMGTGTRMGMGTGMRTGLGTAEEGLRSSTNGTRIVDAIRNFHSACVMSLQTGVSACGHPTAPFARPGAGTCASYGGGNRV